MFHWICLFNLLTVLRGGAFLGFFLGVLCLFEFCLVFFVVEGVLWDFARGLPVFLSRVFYLLLWNFRMMLFF